MGEALPTFHSANPDLSDSESKDGDDEREEVAKSEKNEPDDKCKGKARARPAIRLVFIRVNRYY